jgi:hypothetical protein
MDRRIWRGVGVLLLVVLAAGALAITPATAGKFLTKKRAMKLFYTKAAADALFIDGAEGDGRYIQDTIFYREGAPLTISNGSEDYVEVDCPAGTKAVGGGGYATGTYMFIEASYPSDGTDNDLTGTTAWTVWAYNDSGGDADLYPYVICVRADTVDKNFP